MKPFLGNFYRHLAIFIWSHWSLSTFKGWKALSRGGHFKASSSFQSWNKNWDAGNWIFFASDFLSFYLLWPEANWHHQQLELLAPFCKNEKLFLQKSRKFHSNWGFETEQVKLFLKMGIHGLFQVFFGLFQTNITNFTKN